MYEEWAKVEAGLPDEAEDTRKVISSLNKQATNSPHHKDQWIVQHIARKVNGEWVVYIDITTTSDFLSFPVSVAISSKRVAEDVAEERQRCMEFGIAHVLKGK